MFPENLRYRWITYKKKREMVDIHLGITLSIIALLCEYVDSTLGMGYRESFKKAVPPHLKIALLPGICSIIGTVAAVLIAVNIPKFWLKLDIGLLVLLMGVIILACLNRHFKFSWLKGLAVKCSRQSLFSYQFADVGQENLRNVAKSTLNE